MGAAGHANGVLGLLEGGSGQVGDGAGNAELEAVLLEANADVGGVQRRETLQPGAQVNAGVDAANVPEILFFRLCLFF